MKLALIFPLSILLLTAIVVQSMQQSDELWELNEAVDTSLPDNYQLIYNGTSYDADDFDYYSDVGFSWEMGALSILIGGLAIGAISGFNFLGSGANAFSTSIIFYATVFLGLWALLSSFTLNLFTSIPIFGAGWIAYFILTFIYCIGIVELSGGIGSASRR